MFICYNFYHVLKRKSSSILYSVFCSKRKCQLDNAYPFQVIANCVSSSSQELFSDRPHVFLYFISSPSNLWNSLWLTKYGTHVMRIMRLTFAGGEKQTNNKTEVNALGWKSKVGFRGSSFFSKSRECVHSRLSLTGRNVLSCVQS